MNVVLHEAYVKWERLGDEKELGKTCSQQFNISWWVKTTSMMVGSSGTT